MNYTLLISPQKTIQQIREEFTSWFPFLKIEFFREPAGKGNLLSKDKMFAGHETLGQVQSSLQEGDIHFHQDIQVGEFEKSLFESFGLCVQVFRKSGNLWLETSATDSWSLQQQNDEGKSLAEHWKIEPEDLNDHDIY
jgi:hypothetical protein